MYNFGDGLRWVNEISWLPYMYGNPATPATSKRRISPTCYALQHSVLVPPDWDEHIHIIPGFSQTDGYNCGVYVLLTHTSGYTTQMASTPCFVYTTSTVCAKPPPRPVAGLLLCR